ncbi:MAG: glycosyltransferase family 39 protein [candidate division WOR-3 bacterium]|nr:MAG: glycosyltransferase family 39 protein [candidate division WOR-3 bacterium]
MSVASGPRPRSAHWFGIIATAGFVVRLAYILQSRGSDPLFNSPQMDSLYHHRWALAVASGTEFISDAFFRAPLYPYFLGLIYRLAGADLLSVRIVQAVVGGLSCGLMYLLARRILAERQDAGLSVSPSAERNARITGFVMAAYPMAVYFDAELLIPVLLLFLLLFGLILLYRSCDQDRQWYLPGLVFGLAAITRPNVLAFLAGLVVWLFLRYRRRAWKRILVLLGAAAMVILPVTVRNYVVGRRFVPIAWQAGTNFYIGNNPESDGVTAILPGTRASWWGGFNDVKSQAEVALGRRLRGADIDRYWLSRGLEFWRERPLQGIRLLLRKLLVLTSGAEVSNNRDVYFFKRYTWLDRLVFRTTWLKFPFGLLLPLSLVGVVLTWRSRKRLLPVYVFVVSYGFSFVLFFVTARFRMGLIPPLVLLAVCGAAELWRSRGRRLALGLLVFVLGFGYANAPLIDVGRADPSQNHFMVAEAMYKTGKSGAALAELRKGLQQDSAYNLLTLEASVLMSLRRPDEAGQAARAAVRREPGMPDGFGTLGNVFAAIGKLDSAEICFQRAVALDPYSVQGWNNLGNTALSRGDLEQARSCYVLALEVDPVFVPAHFHLGLLDYYENRRAEAHARWQKILRLDPSFGKARQALDQLR